MPEEGSKKGRKKKNEPLEMKLSEWNKIDFDKSTANYDDVFKHK